MIRTLRFLVPTTTLLLAACGASDDTEGASSPADGEKESAGSKYDYGAAFEPAPAAEGYTRIVAPIIKDIPPGGDITYCQYVMAPVDRDMDILDVSGEQSAGGHHTVAFSVPDAEVGKSEVCAEGELMQTGFLGGTGGDGAAIQLPDGVAFRLTKGSGIMLNTHFLNTSDQTIDGESVLDLKIVEADPGRRVAGLFIVGNTLFSVPAKGQGEASTECTLEKDIEFFAISNHMHEYGKSASSLVKRTTATAPETVNDVLKWSSEMVGNPTWSMFLGGESLKLAKGDTVTVNCAWDNSSGEDLSFPREMCFTAGMFFADGVESRMCFNGMWTDSGSAASP